MLDVTAIMPQFIYNFIVLMTALVSLGSNLLCFVLPNNMLYCSPVIFDLLCYYANEKTYTSLCSKLT